LHKLKTAIDKIVAGIYNHFVIVLEHGSTEARCWISTGAYLLLPVQLSGTFDLCIRSS